MATATKPTTTTGRGKKVPQATAAPTAQSAAAEELAALKLVAQRRINQAKQLEKERGELQKRIGSNRESLRQMLDNNELPAEFAKWVQAFYPEKERGSRRDPDEITATRKLREEARKDGNQ